MTKIKQMHVAEQISLGDGYTVTISLEAHKEMHSPREEYRNDGHEYIEEDIRIANRLRKIYGEWGFGIFVVAAIISYQGVPLEFGQDNLGACSYYGPIDFMRPGGYYEDMRQTAYEEARRKLKLSPRRQKEIPERLPRWLESDWAEHVKFHGWVEPARVA